VDWKASTRSQKKKLKQTTPVRINRLRLGYIMGTVTKTVV